MGATNGSWAIVWGKAAGFRWLVLCCLCGVLALPAQASFPGMRFQVEQIESAGIRIENLLVELYFHREGLQLRGTIDALSLPDWPSMIKDIEWHCPRVLRHYPSWVCREAVFTAQTDFGPVQMKPVQLAWDPEQEFLFFGLHWVGWLDERGHAAGIWSAAQGLQVDFSIESASLPMGVDFLSRRVPGTLEDSQIPLPQQGVLDLRGRWQLAPQTRQLELDWQLSDLAFSDRLGLRAGDAVTLAGSIRQLDALWQTQGRTLGGAVFWDPVYWEQALQGGFQWDFQIRVLEQTTDSSAVNGPRWEIGPARLYFDHPSESRRPSGIPGLEADRNRLFIPASNPLRVGSDGEIHQGSFSWNIPALERWSEWLVEPLSERWHLPGIAVQGGTTGEIRFHNGHWDNLRVALHEMYLEERAQRLRLDAVTGQMHWNRQAPGLRSTATIASGAIFGLPMGAFTLEWLMEPEALELQEPFWIPMFGGGPAVESLRLDWESQEMQLALSGGIRSLQLPELTSALGLPTLSGTLAGVIPRVAFTDRGLQVGGNILLQVFDGEVVIGDLRVQDLFGRTPVLEANAVIRRLDLQKLTGAFDFGRVEGRISGHVQDLVLVNWIPERMDLEMRTPDKDPGRRRISQRAIDNLSAAGNGLGTAPSVFFLRFFEDFSYRRLGFSCHLRAEVCHAAGVREWSEEAFLLVEGGGLPRIDIIGHNRLIDWPELVRRLAASREGTITVSR